MSETFKDKLISILKSNPKFLNEEGELLKNKVKESALNIDEDLIELLIQEESLKSHFFKQIKNVYVFESNKFLNFISDKHFLSNSTTKFRNKIGLAVGNSLLHEQSNVVLNFPFKDCVLEGGQDKEESKRREIFYNEILAPDEIDRLFDNKVLTNFKKFTKNGEEKVEKFNRDESGTIRDNLIIKGNNLLALHSLKQEFAGKVKLIYIDPPYYFSENKTEDSFAYNSNFKLSTWLTFMKNRLEIGKELLSEDGIFMIQIDDDGQAYLKVLMDEIEGFDYLNTVTILAKASSGASGGGEDKKLKKNTEYVHIFSKKDFVKFNSDYQKIDLEKYIQNLKDEGKNFAYKSVLVSRGDSKYFTSTKDGKGEEIKIFKHSNYQIKTVSQISKEENLSEIQVYFKYFDNVFTTENAQTSIRDRVSDSTKSFDDLLSIQYTPVSGKNKGKATEIFFIGKTKRLVSFLKSTCEIENKRIFKLLKIGSLWNDLSWSSISLEGGVSLSGGKKPEKLLKRIIDMSTDEGDIVLDYHLGSGTTAAVAHKMNRQYIGVEQIQNQVDLSLTRLQNVIQGDTTGISKAVEWSGGGEFIYFELKKYNEEAKEKILQTKTTDELLNLFDELYNHYFLNYNVDIKQFKEQTTQEAFRELSLQEQQDECITMLDLNQMYVNVTEIEDSKYNISQDEIELNKNFYNEK